MSEPNAGLDSLTIGLMTLAFALAGPLLSMAPLGMAPLTIATAVLATGAERFRAGAWPRPPRKAILFSAIFLAWSALSLAWDINPGDGARKLLDMALVVGAALALIGLADRLSGVQRRRLAGALIGGIILGLILLAIETLFDFPIYRAVMGRSDPRLFGLVESKRSVDALPLLVWPAALGLARLRRPWLGLGLAIVFTVACIRLTASSATLGMALSLAIFGLAMASVQLARRLLSVVTVLAFVLIIPFAIAAYDAGGSTVSWLKRSGQHRMEIWRFAAERSLDRPWFGHGLNSSRFIPNGGAVSAFLGPGKPIIPLHPHDAFLQIWLELGVVGVMIVGAMLLAALADSRKWPADTARFALAGYAAMLVVAGLAFGVWQSWWMATLAFSAAACRALAPGPDHA